MEELRIQAHEKAVNLIKMKFYTKVGLSKVLDVSLTTIHNRLKFENWTGPEINVIMSL